MPLTTAHIAPSCGARVGCHHEGVVNPYLQRMRERHAQLVAAAEQMLATATDQNRDLTEAEFASVREIQAQADKLVPEIKELTEREVRQAEVAQLAATLSEAQTSSTDAQERTKTAVAKAESATRAVDRDPGHYRRDGQYSYFADAYLARTRDDSDARQRLEQHARALDMANEGPGVIPPSWMTSEFQQLAYQQRRASAAVRKIPISNAAPITMPRESVGVTTVAAQSAEGANNAGWFTDTWDSAATVVSPVPIAGGQDVSRQLLESGNPAVDMLLFSNMVEEYNQDVEAAVVAAMVTAAGSAVATYATEAAWTTGLDPAEATYVGDAIIDASLAVRNARKLPADVLITSVIRYGSLLKIKDASGRPIMPSDSGGPQNVIGTGEVSMDGRIHGLGVLATDGITQYPESVLAARASDTILFESPMLRFRYEEVGGPSNIRLGVWAYVGVHVKHSGKSVKRIEITAAA